MRDRIKTLFLGLMFLTVGSVPAVAAAQPYPYLNQNGGVAPAQLACAASLAQVRAGEAVSFVATGGTSPVFNWATRDHAYLNTGRQLTLVLHAPGTHTVTVSAGIQTASCAVTVLPAQVSTAPTTQAYSYPVTHFAAQYMPGLPNTGFAPITTASVVFAVVLLMAAGLFVSPYVKRTLAATFR